MITSERAYRLLLRAYPKAFRARFEGEMLIAFRELQRERSSAAQFWWTMVMDIIVSAPALRLEMSRAGWADEPQHKGAIMKTMGIIATLVGAVTIVNASIEGWMGGITNHDPKSLLAGGLGVLAGAAMVMAGAFLVRRSAHAVTRAQAAALICVAAFVLMLVISPRLSVAANLLGIGFPLLLVAVAQFNRDSGRHAPSIG